MSQRSKIWQRFRTVSEYGVSQLLTLASVLFISIVVIRFHSNELWGHYAELLIWGNVILLFLSFGSHDYLLRRFSDAPSGIFTDWASNVLTRSLLLIPSLAVIWMVPVFRQVGWLLSAWVLLHFVNASFRVLVLFQRHFRFNILLEILYTLVVLGCLLFWTGVGLPELILFIVLGQLIKTLGFGIYYARDLAGGKIAWDFKSMAASLIFFIPMAVGTVRMKMDAYYGTYFFEAETLSKYQVFISFLMIAQMVGPFILNPYLKNFYRSGQETVQKLHKVFFAGGWIVALLMTCAMYLAFVFVYDFQFTWKQYLLAFIFMVPLMVHSTLVNEYYKKYLQGKIAFFSTILVVVQVGLGYFLIRDFEINGALALKALGQWAIVLLLWWWIRRKKEQQAVEPT